MSIILHIDSAIQFSSVCLSANGQIAATLVSPSEKESASWLHVAIKNILTDNDFSVNQLSAVAVSAGPGSYTGLRVGMSAAKGLCYALNIPLITISTLQMMAAAASAENEGLLCPMIDARRMEVFTAIYDENLREVMPATNMILEQTSFSEWLMDKPICFFGNGSTKASTVIYHQNATFKQVNAHAAHMVKLTQKKLNNKDFANLAYTEPTYGKDFHSSIPKKLY